MAESIEEVLRELGDDKAADEIAVHNLCHDEIAEMAGRIVELEAERDELKRVVEVLAEDVQWEEQNWLDKNGSRHNAKTVTAIIAEARAEAKAKEGE